MKSAAALLALISITSGCGEHAQVAPHTPPVRVEHPIAANELGLVRFTSEAVRRLGLQTTRVEQASVRDTRLVAGEVIVPPGRLTIVGAPVGGELRAGKAHASLTPGTTVARGDVLLRLVPFAAADRDLHARVERELAVTSAQLSAAESRVNRISQAGADKAVSRRAYEEAVAARDILRADVQAAEARAQSARDAPLLADVALTIKAPSDGVVRALSALPGQAVAAGAPLLELVAVDALQVRVPVYAGDLSRLDATVSARVRSLSAALLDVTVATPVSGPPTASPERATVDRYFALSHAGAFSPGERVLVELPLRTEHAARSVPRSALIYDASGAAWVYACSDPLSFRRVRIDPIRSAEERLVFTRGPALDGCVASVGVAEIFGSEFEPGH